MPTVTRDGRGLQGCRRPPAAEAAHGRHEHPIPAAGPSVADGGGVTAQREDRDPGGSLVGLQAARRFPSVHHREGQVHHDNVGAALERPLDGFRTAGGLYGFEARELEVLSVHLAGIVVVVYEQDPWFLVGTRQWRRWARIYHEVLHINSFFLLRPSLCWRPSLC